jgi:hypothetical protein
MDTVQDMDALMRDMDDIIQDMGGVVPNRDFAMEGLEGPGDSTDLDSFQQHAAREYGQVKLTQPPVFLPQPAASAYDQVKLKLEPPPILLPQPAASVLGQAGQRRTAAIFRQQPAALEPGHANQRHPAPTLCPQLHAREWQKIIQDIDNCEYFSKGWINQLGSQYIQCLVFLLNIQTGRGLAIVSQQPGLPLDATLIRYNIDNFKREVKGHVSWDDVNFKPGTGLTYRRQDLIYCSRGPDFDWDNDFVPGPLPAYHPRAARPRGTMFEFAMGVGHHNIQRGRHDTRGWRRLMFLENSIVLTGCEFPRVNPCFLPNS